MADFDLDAAGLRADRGEVTTGVEVLAAKLEAALPQVTTVERRSRRMFSKDKVVASIEVRLGDGRYALRVAGRGVEATREHEVRGIVIRREPLGLEAWVAALTDELREQARGSAEARTALDRLVG